MGYVPQSWMLELVRYIHLNPLRAGMLPDLAAVDQYPWTGHAVLLGHHTRPWQVTDVVLRQFATTVGPARLRRAFIAAALAAPPPDLDGGGLRRPEEGDAARIWRILRFRQFRAVSPIIHVGSR